MARVLLEPLELAATLVDLARAAVPVELVELVPQAVLMPPVEQKLPVDLEPPEELVEVDPPVLCLTAIQLGM